MAIGSVKPLCSVKDQSDKLHMHTCKMIYYDQHDMLLLSVELGYDSQFTSASSKSTRKVYHTKLGGSYFEICPLS